MVMTEGGLKQCCAYAL